MHRLRLLFVVVLIAVTSCKKTPGHLAKVEVEAGRGLTAIVTKEGVNLRQSASVNAPVVSILPKGASLTVLEKSAEPVQIYKCPYYWFHATYGQKTGWVYGEFLTGFSDTNRRIYTTEEEGLKIQMSIPESWQGNSSVLSDGAGGKIMETRPPEDINGDFETAIRAFYKGFDNSEHPYRVHSVTKILHPKVTVFRVMTETSGEGGCPNWVGKVYPVGYYFQIHGTQYLDITFYSDGMNDIKNIALFDEIAQTVSIN